VSYAKHPAKQILNVAGRAFQWLLEQLHKKGKINSFALFNTQDFAKQCAVDNTHTKVFLGDVKNMYTNLPHEDLFQAIDWVLNLAESTFDMHQIHVPKNKTKKPYVGTKLYNHVVTISFSHIKEILVKDINNIFFTIGKRVARQTQGVPMGSPCSPALAIALCSFYEHNFLTKNPNRKFYGWRFMDDLLMCVPPSMDTSELTNIYPKPLDLEEEKVQTNSTFKYLQTETKVEENCNIQIGFVEKNTQRMVQGKQPLKNIVPFDSHVVPTMHFSRVVGALHAILHHTNSHSTLKKGVDYQMKEFKRHGLSRHMQAKCLRYMAQKTHSHPHGASSVFRQKLPHNWH